MNFRVEYDHEKFLSLCCKEEYVYLIENEIEDCIRIVYHPEVTPDDSEANVVPWFWSHGCLPLLNRIESVFGIYFPFEETQQFTGYTEDEFISIATFAKIIRQKLIDTKNGIATEKPITTRGGF